MTEPFEAHLNARDLSPRTVAGYLQGVAQFNTWLAATVGRPVKSSELTLADGKAFRSHLRAQVSPATVNARLAALRAFGEFAVATGAIAVNPFAELKGIDEQPRGPRWLSDIELHRLRREVELAVVRARSGAARVEALRNQAALIGLAFNAGLRVSEICALTVGDIQIGERSGRVLVRYGKGNKSRSVPLNAEAREVIGAWLKVHPALGEGNTPPLFVGQRGEALQPRGIQRALAKLAALAGVECTPHQLRHSMGYRVNQSAGLVVAAALLGHSSLNTTRRYTTPSTPDLTRAVEALG